MTILKYTLSILFAVVLMLASLAVGVILHTKYYGDFLSVHATSREQWEGFVALFVVAALATAPFMAWLYFVAWPLQEKLRKEELPQREKYLADQLEKVRKELNETP